MTDLLAIAETMSTEFTGAVREAQRAQTAALDGLLSRLDDAQAARIEELGEVRRMREDAARIVAASIKREEEAERAFNAAVRAIRTDLNALRAPVAVPVVKRPQLQAAE